MSIAYKQEIQRNTQSKDNFKICFENRQRQFRPQQNTSKLNSQHIKGIVYYAQLRFIPGIPGWFTICK